MKQRINLNNSLLFLFICMNLCRNFLWLIPSVMMSSIMAELGINYAQAGYLVLIVTVMMGVFLFAGNYLLGWISPPTAMTIGLLCSAADGICSFLGQSFGVIMVGKALGGIGYGLTTCASTALITSSFPKEKLGIINGVNACTASLTITCAYQFIIPLADSLGSWKMESLFWAIGSLITILLFLLWKATTGYQSPRRQVPVRGGGYMRQAVQYRFVRCCMLIMNSLMLVSVYISSYYPNYLHAVQGLTMQEAGSLAGKISVFGMIGSLLMGVLVGKIRNSRRVSIAMVLMLGGGFCGMILLRQYWLLLAAVCCFGGCFSALSSFLSTRIMQLPDIPPLAASAGVTIMSGIGSLIALAVPQVHQTLSDTVGLPATMIAFGVLFLPAIIGTLRIPQNSAS